MHPITILLSMASLSPANPRPQSATPAACGQLLPDCAPSLVPPPSEQRHFNGQARAKGCPATPDTPLISVVCPGLPLVEELTRPVDRMFRWPRAAVGIGPVPYILYRKSDLWFFCGGLATSDVTISQAWHGGRIPNQVVRNPGSWEQTIGGSRVATDGWALIKSNSCHAQ